MDYFEMVMDNNQTMFYWSKDSACYTGFCPSKVSH